ncbi:hypothetical protein AWZ03_012383 [Drosophila navojoa]|uniref:Uncharacterized protein n=1 Tax=Drosophila navojoa TaxID=7232 RepID=A0A484B047_DRONA|nr:hypothetical protein AWZ03_012383 [Drosophila navojoa]
MATKGIVDVTGGWQQQEQHQQQQEQQEQEQPCGSANNSSMPLGPLGPLGAARLLTGQWQVTGGGWGSLESLLITALIDQAQRWMATFTFANAWRLLIKPSNHTEAGK